jgi:nitroimidazol reductase NimA-like FMN-containing flavoprotein (pyridoxamine 5'-phosphate oxidase superfamily)
MSTETAETETSLLTERTTLHRLPERGHHDRATIDAILDEALVCHLGFNDGEQPFVIPTVFARIGNDVVVHGSAASRTLRTMREGIPVCITVTLLDGLVLARSAFHHSVNYRSVVLLGTATPITDPDEKAAALDAIVEHTVPGRSAEARPGNDKEIKGTIVLRLPINEASAKIRIGMPKDDDEDMDLPVWAGVIPLRTVVGPPEPDAYCTVDAPAYVRGYQRPG